MAIYLDTNVICRWRSFGELDRLALSIVADQIGQPIVVPELVVIEATAHYSRELEGAVERFYDIAGELKDFFTLEYVHAEPQPDPEQRQLDWRRRLEEICEVAPLHPDDAVRALEYEVHGRAPARERSGSKPGAGARDAAIWLSLLRDHRKREEAGYFITKNKKDFFDGNRLKARLLRDLEGASHPVHAHIGIEAMLTALGTSATEVSVDLEAISKEGLEAVRRGLADAPTVPRAVFDSLDEHRFRTVVTNGRASKVVKAQRFEHPTASVLMVDAEWELQADCLYQSLKADDPDWWGILRDVKLKGRLQIYLPAEGSEGTGQLIAAQLSSDKEASFMDDGLIIWG